LESSQRACLLESSLVSPVLPVRAMSRWRWTWSIGGVALTGENRSTGEKICPSTIWSSTNLTRTTWE
jgi:hypothetical protein